MKASELINNLKQVIEKNGDFEVIAGFSPSASNSYWESVNDLQIVEDDGVTKIELF